MSPESRRIYRVGSNKVDEINRVLSLLSDRLDELEGYRGSPDFKNEAMKVNGVAYTWPAAGAKGVLKNDGAGALTWAGYQSVIKTADEIVNDSVTLQNDDELFFSIGANQIWRFEIFLRVMSGSPRDITFGFSAPAGCTMSWGSERILHDVGSASTPQTALSVTDTLNCGTIDATTENIVVLRGVVINSTGRRDRDTSMGSGFRSRSRYDCHEKFLSYSLEVTMTTTYKSNIGKEDFSIQTNTNAAETFTRNTSTGGAISMTKMPDIWDGTGQIKLAKVLVYAADSPTTVLHSFGGVS